jgi:hypothetical protein
LKLLETKLMLKFGDMGSFEPLNGPGGFVIGIEKGSDPALGHGSPPCFHLLLG